MIVNEDTSVYDSNLTENETVTIKPSNKILAAKTEKKDKGSTKKLQVDPE